MGGKKKKEITKEQKVVIESKGTRALKD